MEAKKKPILMHRYSGFSLPEAVSGICVACVLAILIVPALFTSYRSAGRAISAHVLAELSSAAASYLSDNRNIYWRAQATAGRDTQWWFGYETFESVHLLGEGNRILDYSRSPLGPYIAEAGGLRSDPSFADSENVVKPKYKFGHFAFGYNTLLDGINHLTLDHLNSLVVFATSAQINTFQAPASPTHPMLEEFYMLYDGENTAFSAGKKTVHFRHNGKAMVAFADGSVDFITQSPSQMDTRLPSANVGSLPSININPNFHNR